nr:hypothetical protein [Actinomadura madurae]
MTGQQFAHLVFGCADRDHQPARRKRLHEPPARRHQCARIRQGEHPGNMCSSDLPYRVAHHHIRPNTPRLQQTERANLHREQARLPKDRVPQVSALAVGTEDDVAQRARQQIAQQIARLIERGTERREPIMQLSAHTRPLGPLTREHQRKSAVDSLLGDLRVALRDGTQPRAEPFEIGCDGRRTMLERGSRGRQCPGHIPDVNVRVGLYRGQEPACLSPHRLRRPARQQQRNRHGTDHRPRFQFVAGLRFTLGGGFEDDVGVGPTDPERGHTRTARPSGLRPVLLLGQQFHRARRPVHMRRRRIHMQRLGQHAMAHRLHHLDHTRHTRSSLRMTDVRLQRPQPQRMLTSLPIGGEQRLRLDRVTQPRAGAMCLDRVHLRR